MIPLERLQTVVREQPYPLLFVTVSGAHLYGFPSADSDFDLRGVHLLPLSEIVGLERPRETLETATIHDGLKIDLVTHDARKFFALLLKPNGYVLEQLYSPLIVRTSDDHHELKELARGCITRVHVRHYLGFAQTQWNLFLKERRIKPLLYLYRVLLTGMHLMRTGEVEANLVSLNELYPLPQVPALLAAKIGGGEHDRLHDADIAFHERERSRLEVELQAAAEASHLSEASTARPALNDLLLRLRLGEMACD